MKKNKFSLLICSENGKSSKKILFDELKSKIKVEFSFVVEHIEQHLEKIFLTSINYQNNDLFIDSQNDENQFQKSDRKM